MDTTTQALMTAEEMLALPETDEVDRELIYGELRETPMTKRHLWHSQVEGMMVHLIHEWRLKQNPPRGRAHSGEVGCILSHEPDTVVGIDVAYFAPEVLQENYPGTTMIEAVPTLAVEVLSPSDTQERIMERIALYLHVGVKLVWTVETQFRTLTVYRPDADPQMFSAKQEVSGDPHLPGFRFVVGSLFE